MTTKYCFRCGALLFCTKNGIKFCSNCGTLPINQDEPKGEEDEEPDYV